MSLLGESPTCHFIANVLKIHIFRKNGLCSTWNKINSRGTFQTKNKENRKQKKVYGHWRDYLIKQVSRMASSVDNKDGEVIKNGLGIWTQFSFIFSWFQKLELPRVIPARCMSLIFTLFFIITRAKISKSTRLSMRNHIIWIFAIDVRTAVIINSWDILYYFSTKTL